MIPSVSATTADSVEMPARLRAVTPPAGYDYLLSLPADYTAETQRRWPLLLFLHGTGERGTNVWDVARQGVPKLLAGPADLSPAEVAIARDLAARFIVVSPQCAPQEVWDDATLLALLDDVGQHLNVDAARVSLTGLSMGGFGVWSLGLRHPQRFAALAPICGGGRLADVEAALRDHRSAFLSLGVWAFHGAKDRVVPLEESSRMIEALHRAGVSDARLTIYPDTEHDAWTQTYANSELYAWLLRHAR